MSVNRIEFLRYYVTRVLPLVYDDALSYYEVLAKVSKKLNEAIETLNELAETVANIETDFYSYADEKFLEAKNYADGKVNALALVVDEKYDTLDSKIDSTATILRNDYIARDNVLQDNINACLSEIESNYRKIKAYVDTENANLKAYVDYELEIFKQEIIELLPDNISIYNPVNGKLQPINTVIESMYNALRYDALTCSEYDSLNLTASEYDNLGLSAYDFDLYGKKLLYKDNNHYMFSPFTGEYVTIKSVIYELAQLHAVSPITAINYDNLEISATDFEGYDMTAYDYDNNAQAILVA